MSFWLLLVAALVACVVALAVAAWLFTRGQSAEMRALAGRIWRLPWRAKARLALALFRDRRIPLWARAIIPGLVLYLVLPIDIIPDFIPVLGHLDDLAVLLVAGGLLMRAIPHELLEQHVGQLETSRPEANPAPE